MQLGFVCTSIENTENTINNILLVLSRTNNFLIEYDRRCSWLGRSSLFVPGFRPAVLGCRSANFLLSAKATQVHFSKCSGAGIPWASDLERLDLLGCRRWARDASRICWSWFVFRPLGSPQMFLTYAARTWSTGARWCSVQYTIREILIVKAFWTDEIKEARRSAPLSSSRGMVSVLSGATFDFAVSKWV